MVGSEIRGERYWERLNSLAATVVARRRNGVFRAGALIAALAVATSAGADYEAGQRAWNAGQREAAVAEWQRSARRGDTKAMLALGRLYTQGIGVPQNYVQAHKWFNLAASRGEGTAIPERDALGSRMTPEERAEAHRLALEWQPGSSTEASPTPPPDDQEDRESEAIREVQSVLASLGYQPGLADGIWGGRTTRALEAFLRDSGLPRPESLTETLGLLRSAAQRTEPARVVPQPFTVVAEPSAARVRILNIEERYQAGMGLPIGRYEVEVSAAGYEPIRETIAHGSEPTERRITLARVGPQPFTVMAEPPGAQVRILNTEEEYRAGMALAPGEYEVEVSATGYEPTRETIQHGTRPTEHRVALARIVLQPFTVVAEPSAARVRILNIEDRYQAGMGLPAGAYQVEVSAAGYEPIRETIAHGSEPTERRVALVKAEPRRQVGQRFRDCPICPEMVVVPAGSFMMGSPITEEGHDATEEPQRKIRIAQPLAVGVYEVTFAEWDACVSNGGCNGYRPDDAGWNRGRQPVINVSWGEAQAYVAWLAEESGRPYRLLSEAEWEYVARAGTRTPFHFGPSITPPQANYDARYIYEGGWKGEDRRRTIPVGSFQPNAFGLYDVHGNAWEWVQDCWNMNHAGASENGQARETGDCSRRILRGGAWIFSPNILRSASRNRYAADYQYAHVGFRVARTLPYLIPPETEPADPRPEIVNLSGGGTDIGRAR